MGLHRSSGQARVVLSGVEHYLGVWGSPEAHAKYAALVHEWLAQGKQPLRRAPTTREVLFTVRELFAQYLNYLDTTGRYRKRGEPTSQRGLVERSLSSFEKLAGGVAVAKVSEALLVTWRDRLEAENPKMVRTSINRKVGLVLAVLRWGRARGLVPRDAWADASAIVPLRRGECGARPEHGRPRRAPSFADVEKVAQACASPMVGDMLRLQALLCCRPGEVTSMRHQDIDRTPVLAPDGTPCWTYTVPSPKTEHHGRTVRYYLPPVAQALIELYPGLPTSYVFSPTVAMEQRRRRLRESRRTPPTKQMRQRDATACHDYGDHWGRHEYRRHVVEACRRAGVAEFTVHEVRHAALTWAAAECGVTAAMAAANHASAAITARYVHRDEAQALSVAAAVQKRATAG